MAVKHLVFDWDGTLADTYPVISAAYEHTFKILNLPSIPYDEIKRLTSTLPNKDTLGYIFGNHKNEAQTAYYDYINKHHTDKLQAISDSSALLQFATDNGFFCYLLSNKKRPYLLAEVQKLGFNKYFKQIVAAGDYPEDKPHPLATNAIFNNHLPAADSILTIGDGEADYQTARTFDYNNQKSLCVIIDSFNKYHGPQPDYLVKDLKSIINILKEKS